MGSYRRHCSSRRTCSINFTLLVVLVLLVAVALVTGSRVSRAKKHHKSRGTSTAARWQARASTEGASNGIHESAPRPAPFSKPAHSGAPGGSGAMKRAYYVPTVTNLENKLHHFISNLKTGIGASKLAHAVNGVTGAIQHQVSMSGHGLAGNLLGGAHRPSGVGSYFGSPNELRYGQPFVSKQSGGHFKSAAASYGKKGAGGETWNGKRGRSPTQKATPQGKYDSLMSDLGISGYKHFENAVIRDLERREELKVEATIHTLFPEGGDEEWRPITSGKRPSVPVKAPGHFPGTRPTGPEHSESKIVSALTVALPEKRPAESKPSKLKPVTVGYSGGVRHGASGSSTASPKPPGAPTHAIGQKHRSKGGSLPKEKRTKERTKCWSNCANASSTSTTTRQPSTASHSLSTRLPVISSTQPQRFGPSYDAAMFYGSDGKPSAALGPAAQSYSNVEVHYNRTLAPPFVGGPWTEVNTQSAPPVTTLSLGLPEVVKGTNGPAAPYTIGSIKKSFSKLVKPYGPATAYAVQQQGDEAGTSTTTHKPTGGSQGTKATTHRKRTTHKPDGLPVGHHRRPLGKAGDSVGAGSSKSELRVRKKFDPKYARNRGSIKFKDALQQNPDQIYR